MNIQKKDVLNVANLSRLNLDEKVVEKIALQIEDILKYVETLNEVNTENIEPTFHVISKTNAFRDDTLHEHAIKEDVLLNAPQSDDDNFIVPQVI
jgi:aspartyl-tRNA(Asn)/glutamyl-tRNA(Gln) amidotransferase subunit C